MAATTAIAGFSGSITGPTGFVEVTQWKLTLTTAALDATSMASAGFEEFITGLKGAKGTATCQGTVIPVQGLSAGTLKTASTGGATISGSILIHEVGIGVPVEGKVTYDVSFNFTGSITVA